MLERSILKTQLAFDQTTFLSIRKWLMIIYLRQVLLRDLEDLSSTLVLRFLKMNLNHLIFFRYVQYQSN
jgi:hypothetical protein